MTELNNATSAEHVKLDRGPAFCDKTRNTHEERTLAGLRQKRAKGSRDE